jgi:hypothetical protein
VERKHIESGTETGGRDEECEYVEGREEGVDDDEGQGSRSEPAVDGSEDDEAKSKVVSRAVVLVVDVRHGIGAQNGDGGRSRHGCSNDGVKKDLMLLKSRGRRRGWETTPVGPELGGVVIYLIPGA